jgi:asparagine synthase (glutamine-hydrolysing)
MSGFAGILNLDGAPVDRDVLDRMTESMAFRGPDSQEAWLDGSVGMSHAMLRSTWEAARERQPASLGGRLWIVADARIDARADLLRELHAESKYSGQASLATPDSELILDAFDTWGDECVAHLLGDFSFAIWDAPKERLFCARDHFGVKPFYYSRIGNTLVFGNTLDTLRLYPGMSNELCDAAIADFLLFGGNFHPAKTPWEQILRLPRAHTLVATRAELRTREYWSVPIEEPLRYRNGYDYVEQFRELLHQAVKDRLRCDRASISLSGGLDSPSVAAEAAKQLGAAHNLLGITGGYTRLHDPEPHYAQLVAEYLKISRHFIALDDYQLFDRLDSPELRCPWPLDRTFGAVHCDFMDRVAEHGRVLLTGQGGDPGLVPSLTGYRGAALLDLLLGMARYAVTHGRHPRIGFRVSWRRSRDKWGVAPTDDYPCWLEPEFETRLALPDRWNELMREDHSAHPHRPDAHSCLTGPRLLPCQEEESCRAGMSIDFRHPLFDVRIQRFFLRLPVLPWCADKEILRVSMRGSLPTVVLQRPKCPVQGNPAAETIRRTKPHPAILRDFVASPSLARYVVQNRIPDLAPGLSVAGLAIGGRPASLNHWLSQNNL